MVVVGIYACVKNGGGVYICMWKEWWWCVHICIYARVKRYWPSAVRDFWHGGGVHVCMYKAVLAQDGQRNEYLRKGGGMYA